MDRSQVHSLAERLEHAYTSYLPVGKGFLPSLTPVDGLPHALARYQQACDELPDRFGAPNDSVRPWLDKVFAEYDSEITRAIDGLSPMERENVMTMLCTLAHAYRWGSTPPEKAAFELTRLCLPPGLDEPWTHLARLLYQPRVGSLWNVALCNWTLKSKRGGSDYAVHELTLENLRLTHGWLRPPLDRALEVFILTFVETEARGVAVIDASIQLVRSVAEDDSDAVLTALASLEEAIKTMNLVFYKNIRTQLIDPAIWNAWIKPVYGWGVDAGDGVLEGASGLQLGAIQCADAVLGVEDRSFLAKAATEARRYMPWNHQRFLAVVDTVHMLVPAFVRRRGDADLAERYNACVDALRAWRHAHRQRGAHYLQGNGAGPMGRSTGMVVSGREHAAVEEFQALMQERIDETIRARISGRSSLSPTPEASSVALGGQPHVGGTLSQARSSR